MNCFFFILALEHIIFVAHYDQLDILLSVLCDFVQPESLDIFEGFLILYIVCHYYALSTLVVGTGDCTESLLTGCVPYFELGHLAIDFQSPEIDEGNNLNLKSTPMVARYDS